MPPRARSPRLRALLVPVVCALCLLAAPASAGASTGGAAPPSASGALTDSAFDFGPLRWAGATWYGPGLYGNHTACGEILRPGTIGVAHKHLPCNTPVRFRYHGRTVVARVIDRGPYSKGNAWDLTNGARRALGFEGADKIAYAVARNGRRLTRHAR